MKQLVLLRPNREPLRFKIEEVESVIALDYPEGVLKVTLYSGAESLGYMAKFE